MSLQVVWLWTDVLFWGLCLTVLGLSFSPMPQYIRAGWQKVGQSKMGMAAAVIILAYLALALLDSVHFRWDGGGQVKTGLDRLLSPLDEITEMTFSAPFADHLFVSIGELTEQGEVVYGKPPLTYVHPQSYAAIPVILLKGMSAGLGLWLLFMMPIKLALKRGWIRSHGQGIQWRTAFLTALIALMFLGALIALSRYFHIFGTDKVGQDVFYQSLKSIRTGVIIGTVTTLVLLPFAILLGTLAGYSKGWVDDLIQYIYTTLSSIPSILLIAASVLMLDLWLSKDPGWVASVTQRADLRLLSLCVILGATSWTSLCRLLRAETMKLREQDYVTAAIAQGVGRMKIIRAHVLPNLMHIVFITIALDFSALILTEAVLSYVGVGVDPSSYSWGTMINTARLELSREPAVWWSIVAAFFFMATLVLSANLFSDVVQKAFDPRARGK